MRILTLFFSLFVVVTLFGCKTEPTYTLPNNYVVLISEEANSDSEWRTVAEALATKHSASIITFAEAPRDVLDSLRQINPRYVAIVHLKILVETTLSTFTLCVVRWMRISMPTSFGV